MSTIRGNPRPIPQLPPAPANLPASMMLPVDDGAVTYRANVSQLADAVGKAPAGFLAGGTGAVARSIMGKLGDAVSVLDFGAVADGVTDDTAAAQRALDTGKSIVFPAGRDYFIGGTLNITTSRQWATAYGARIIAAGDAPLFHLSGSSAGHIEGCGLAGFYIDGAGKTGGYLVVAQRSSRQTFRDFVVHAPWALLYVEVSNYTEVANVWCNDVRGPVGVHWFGDNSKRSDILRLNAVTISSNTARATGVLWDGNCHTLQCQSLNLVKCGYGIRIINSSGGTPPYFLMGDDIEIDYPKFHGIALEAGGHVYLSPALYIHGSEQGSGIYVKSGVQADLLTATGGKITGNARFGIENNPRVIQSNVHFAENAIGSVSGSSVVIGQRFQVDPQAYFQMQGDSPLLAFDSSDYLTYTRGTNVLGLMIGGQRAFSAGVADLPYLETSRFRLDGTAYFSLSPQGFPTLGFDANDYVMFDRAQDRLSFAIGGAEVMRLEPGVVRLAMPISLPGYTVGTLPSPETSAGVTVRLTDRNQRFATSDGAAWRFPDGSFVS